MKKETMTEEKAKQTPAGGVLVGKREGQTIIHDKGTQGGYFVGKLHKEGGIQGINKSTGQPIEVQGGEVIITAPAVADQSKREFEGEMLTNREILSKINEKGGGVSLENGGEIYYTGTSYNYGGKTMTDYEIMQSMNDCGCEDEYEDGGLSKGKSVEDIAIMHDVTISHVNSQLKKGIIVEMEHTSNKKLAEKIAKDHLYENPNYYTILDKVGLKDGGTIITYKNKYNKKYGYSANESHDLEEIAKDTGISLKGLQQIYNKGIGAYKTNPESVRPNVKSKEQWAMARVYSAVMGGKASKIDANELKMNYGGQLNLMNESKKGDHTSRDLNNYNDLMDVGVDGQVGAESGLFADGGNINSAIQVGDLFVMDLPDILRNKDYGKKRQVAIVTNVDNPEKVLIYNGVVYFNIKETSLLSKEKSSISEVLNEFRNKNDMSVSQRLFSVINEEPIKESIDLETIDLLKERYPNRNIIKTENNSIKITPNFLSTKQTWVSKVLGYYLIHNISNEDSYYVFDSLEDAIDLKYGQPIYAGGGDLKPYDANMDGDSADTMYKEGGATLSAEVFEWDEVPTNYRNISKVKKVPFSNNPMDKGLDSIISPFLGKDDLRPVGMGINFDKNGITATDYHKLITLPYPNEKYEGIYDINRVKKIKADQPILIDGNYPNYEAIIPKSNVIAPYEVDVYKLLQYTKTAMNYANKITKQVSFKFGDNERIGFNGTLLSEVLTACLKLGHEKIYAFITVPNKGIVLSQNKDYELGNDDILLLMPVMLNSASGVGSGLNLPYGAEDIDYNRSLRAYYDFNDNEIHNADGSVAEFKMQYQSNQLVDDNYLALLSKMIKKNRINILEYVKVENGKMTATDLEISLIVKDVNMPNGIYEIVNNAPNITMNPIEDFPSERVFNKGEYETHWEQKKPTAFEFVTFSEVFEFYLDKLLLSVGKDDLRPVMSGICIKKTAQNEMFLVTTDAHTLCKINITEYCEFNKDSRELEYILPVKYLKDFVKLADGSLHFKCSMSNIFIEADNLDFIGRTIDGKYPNYDAVIPRDSTKKIVFDHVAMNKCLKSPEMTNLIAKYKGRKDILFDFFNIGNTLNIKVSERKSYNVQSELIEAIELCKIDFNYQEVESTLSLSKSAFLLMPSKDEFKENQYFSFRKEFFDVMLETITDTEVDCYFSEPNRAYVFPIDAIDYKKTLPVEKTKQQKLSKKDLEQIIELEELKDTLEPINEEPNFEEIINLGNNFEIRVEKVFFESGDSTYGATLYYKNELFKYFVFISNTTKKEAIDNVYKYLKTLKVSDKIIELTRVVSKTPYEYRVIYTDRGGEHLKSADTKKEIEQFIKAVNSITNQPTETNELQEAIETLEMLIGTAKGKEKKEIKEALEILKMLQ